MARIFVAHQEQGAQSPFGGLADAVKEQRLMAEEQRRYEQQVQVESAKLGMQAKALDYQKQRDKVADRFKREDQLLRREEIQVNRQLAERRVGVAEGELGLRREQLELTKQEQARLADLEERKMSLNEAESKELSELRQRQTDLAERKEAREAKESEAQMGYMTSRARLYDAQAGALTDEQAADKAERDALAMSGAQAVESHFAKIGTIPVDQLPAGAQYIAERKEKYDEVLTKIQQAGTAKEIASHLKRLDLLMSEDDVMIEKSQADWTLGQLTNGRQKLVEELLESEAEYGIPAGAIEKAYDASSSDPKQLRQDIERLRELKSLGEELQAIDSEVLQIKSGGLTGPNASAITAKWKTMESWSQGEDAMQDAIEAWKSVESSMEQRVEAGRYLLARTHLEADPTLHSARNALVTSRQELNANKQRYQQSLDMLSAVSQQHLPPMDQSLGALAVLESPEAAAELGLTISPEAAQLAGELNDILGAQSGSVSDQAQAGMMGKQSLYSSLALAAEQMGGLAPETAAELFGVLTELRPGGRYEEAGPKILQLLEDQVEAAAAEEQRRSTTATGAASWAMQK